MQQFNFGIVFLHEVEARDFDGKRPFTLQGYKTYFPKKGKDIKRTLCFVRNDIEVHERHDLMTDSISSVWLEFHSDKGKKAIIGSFYRENAP